MALYAFSLSILLLIGGSRLVWYGAMVFWVSNGIFWASLVMSSAHFGEADLLPLDLTALAVPLLYSLGCLGYFMTSHVRKCFDV